MLAYILNEVLKGRNTIGLTINYNLYVLLIINTNKNICLKTLR